MTNEETNILKEELKHNEVPFDERILKPDNFKEYIFSIFAHISIPEIKKKILNFQKIDLKNISDIELDSAIADVMNIEIDGEKRQIFLPQFYTYSAGTRFYRTRIINTDNAKDIDQFSAIAAYWNPPTEIITKPGRLNKAHESLLYTSLHPNTTFSELKIQPNQTFALIVYEALEPIKMNIIGPNMTISKLSKDVNRKYQLYNNFLRDEFTKEVQHGLEHYYRISEYIAKFYFDLPPRVVQDAWMYPSVAADGEYNVCFRPEIAKEVLKFVGVILGKMITLKGDILFKCDLIGTADSDNNMVFTPENPITMKKLFPEFMSRNDHTQDESFTILEE